MPFKGGSRRGRGTPIGSIMKNVSRAVRGRILFSALRRAFVFEFNCSSVANYCRGRDGGRDSRSLRSDESHELIRRERVGIVNSVAFVGFRNRAGKFVSRAGKFLYFAVGYVIECEQRER